MKLGLYGRGLSRRGAATLGPLERAVMDQAWTQAEVTAAGVRAALTFDRRVSLSTVQSTLDRLHRKRLLTRHKQGRAFVYAAAVSRDDLLGALIAELMDDLSDSGRVSAAAHALDSATGLPAPTDADEATLQRLERWIEARRAASAGDDS